MIAISGHSRVSLLKIEVEGAKSEIFAKNYEHWLPLVDNLVSELHGSRCEKMFHNAIKDQNVEQPTCDELSVYRPPQIFSHQHNTANLPNHMPPLVGLQASQHTLEMIIREFLHYRLSLPHNLRRALQTKTTVSQRLPRDLQLTVLPYTGLTQLQAE